MKNREYLKKYLIQSLIVIVIATILFVIAQNIEYNKYKQNFNHKLSAILEKIENEYPNVDKNDLVEILKSDNAKKDTLKEYGYDIEKDSYISQNDENNLIFTILKLILLLASFITLIYIFIKYSFKNDKEIDKIIKTIENINHKNYEIELDELSEDKLSILKQEIYKTTIMLKENAENSLKDKISIKNSIQDISHQLKTPLTSINILLDNIIDNPDMDSITRNNFIKQIKREIANITFLIQSILKLSKFESNTISFIKKKFSVKKIINEVIKNVSNLCDLKNIHIEVNNKCKNNLLCDFKWQVEALTNIVKNAVEYSYEGNKVVIECEENNIYTQIKIKDFGKGMDKEDTLNIFKRFYKGKDAGKDSIGIGLSLSKAIIEEDNGRIIVDSIKDKGTTFIIRYFHNK